MNEPSRQPGAADPPPAVRGRWPRAVALIGCGIAIAAVLLLVVINLESPAPPPGATDLLSPMSRLEAPPELSDADLAGTDVPIESIGDIAATTGWIETTDPETGAVVQRYRFDRLDPDPPGLDESWFAMQQPEAEIRLSGNRVLDLRGRHAVAQAPNRTLETGTVTGDVEISMRELDAAEPLALRVRTDEASFDNVLGEVHCPGPVDISTRTAEMPGRAVTLRFDDRDGRVAFEMAALDYLLLRGETTAAPAPNGDRAVAPDRAAPAPAPTPPAAPDAPRRDGAARPAPDPTAEPPAEVDFYQLRFHDNVEVRHGPASDRRTARGDLLTVVFSTESQGMPGAVTAAPPPPAPRPPRRLVDVIDRLAFASAPPAPRVEPPEPGPGEVVITCDGRVSLVAIDDPALHPSSPEEVVLELTGAPVRLEDEPGGVSAICAGLVYRLAEDRVELRGTAAVPLVAHLPEATARGSLFRFDMTGGTGGFVGAGRLEIDAGDDTDAPLVIDWSERAAFELLPRDKRDAEPLLRHADFFGDVVVMSDALEVETDEMRVAFAETGARPGAIETITATGAVRATEIGATGAMRCAGLTVWLDEDADRNPVPTRLEARDDVEAELGGRSLWCARLDVGFVADPETRVRDAIADGGVQVRLEDGSRAFAETLTADADAGTVVLEGPRVLIAAERLVIDGGTRLELDRATEVATWPQAGRVRAWNDPVLELGAGPAAPPDVDAIGAAPAILATWSESMRFDSRAGDGAGSIDLRGNVQARLRRTPRERNTLSGRAVTLHLEREDDGESNESTGGRRFVRRLVADGDARLESRAWANDAQSGTPRVFYVAGVHLDYDRSLEAATVDDGTLLIRDDSTANAGATSAPFSGRGITMFRFAEQLTFARTGTDRYRIEMTGAVEGTHKSPDGSTVAMTSRSLEAEAIRATGAGGDGDGADGFGGPMELTRVHARDDVYVATTTRRVQCDDLVYDVPAGRAHLRASPGRVVTILTVGSIDPVTATSIRWDLVTDGIVMESVSAGGE